MGVAQFWTIWFEDNTILRDMSMVMQTWNHFKWRSTAKAVIQWLLSRTSLGSSAVKTEQPTCMADRQTSIRHTHKNKDTPDNEIHVYITVSHQNIGGSVGIQYTCIYNVQECISTHKLCHRTHTHTHTVFYKVWYKHTKHATTVSTVYLKLARPSYV